MRISLSTSLSQRNATVDERARGQLAGKNENYNIVMRLPRVRLFEKLKRVYSTPYV